MMKEEKFKALYKKYYPVAMRTAFSILGDFEFSEDICQEVFLLFSERADTIDEKYYRAWFILTARRKAIDFCRKDYQVHEVAATVSASKDEELQEDITDWIEYKNSSSNYFEDEIANELVHKELTVHFLDALFQKDKDWYEITMRMNIEGSNAEETARALGITIMNLRVKRHRMKKWIEKNYKEEYKNL